MAVAHVERFRRVHLQRRNDPFSEGRPDSSERHRRCVPCLRWIDVDDCHDPNRSAGKYRWRWQQQRERRGIDRRREGLLRDCASKRPLRQQEHDRGVHRPAESSWSSSTTPARTLSGLRGRRRPEPRQCAGSISRVVRRRNSRPGQRFWLWLAVYCMCSFAPSQESWSGAMVPTAKLIDDALSNSGSAIRLLCRRTGRPPSSLQRFVNQFNIPHVSAETAWSATSTPTAVLVDFGERRSATSSFYVVAASPDGTTVASSRAPGVARRRARLRSCRPARRADRRRALPRRPR